MTAARPTPVNGGDMADDAERRSNAREEFVASLLQSARPSGADNPVNITVNGKATFNLYVGAPPVIQGDGAGR